MRGQLEAHFDAAFTAPDGVKRLRELILPLAVQGKLTDQRDSDEPASELLKKIAAKKRKLEIEGKIKKQKLLPPVGDDEKPYALPKGWEWVRLGELGVWRSGSTPSRNMTEYYIGEIPWVKSGEVKQGVISSTEESVSVKALQDCSLPLNPAGTILVAMYGANIGDVGILDIEATTNQAVCACIPYNKNINIYLMNLLKSMRINFIGQGAGAAQPNISKEKIIFTTCPLPPLAEQQRIVERVNNLMARCAALEAKHKEQEHKRNSARAAAMLAITTPQGTTNPTLAFSRNWGFLARHFEQLFTTKQDVAELRKAILQLAVMGKLTNQRQSDEPASELLKRVDADRKRISKQDARSKADLQKEMYNHDHSVPSHWCHRALADLFLFIDYRGRTPQKLSAGIRLITAKNVKKGYISLDPSEFIAEEEYDEWMTRGFPREGDILFTTEAPMGNAAKVNIVERFALAQRVINFRPYADLCTDFFLIQFLSDSFQKILDRASTGMTAKGIKGATLKLLPILIPPLAEQQRIVERVNSLMALCDTLEERMESRTQTQSRLLDAVAATA